MGGARSAVGTRRRSVGDDRAARGCRAAGRGHRASARTAALDNPKCRHDDPKYGAYGRFDSTVVGGGPVCVKEWKAGADNGGATCQGVTKDRITVVAVVPNDTQLETDPVTPNAQGGQVAEHVRARDPRRPDAPDEVLRDVGPRHRDQVHYTSSGSDEAAQRADVVAIKAMKPFAVFNLDRRRVSTCSRPRSPRRRSRSWASRPPPARRNQQAPYRWGLSDAQSAAINSAEVIGKQLVGKKAAVRGRRREGRDPQVRASSTSTTLIDTRSSSTTSRSTAARSSTRTRTTPTVPPSATRRCPSAPRRRWSRA